MKMVRGRRDARWLPSRHNFALFRLFAYLRCRTLAPEPAEVILIVDRHQSVIEYYSVSVWIFVTLTCYLAATLFGSWPVPLAIATSIPVAMVVVQVPLYTFGALLYPFDFEQKLRVQSTLQMLTFLAASAWLTTRTSWVRFAAWQVLAFAVLNAVAAAIVFLLRDRIAQMEEEMIGEAPSAP